MSGKNSPEFQWTDDEIQLLLEATQNLKVEEVYKKITRFYPRPTVIYVLVFLHSIVSFYKKLSFLYHSYYQTLLNLHYNNISLIIVSFLFSFKLEIIPNTVPDVFPLACRSGSIAIRCTSYHFQNRNVPTPLRYENHAEKNMFQWKQKAYPI